MYVCVYIYMYIYICICIYVYICIYIYVYRSAFLWANVIHDRAGTFLCLYPERSFYLQVRLTPVQKNTQVPRGVVCWLGGWGHCSSSPGRPGRPPEDRRTMDPQDLHPRQLLGTRATPAALLPVHGAGSFGVHDTCHARQGGQGAGLCRVEEQLLHLRLTRSGEGLLGAKGFTLLQTLQLGSWVKDSDLETIRENGFGWFQKPKERAHQNEEQNVQFVY